MPILKKATKPGAAGPSSIKKTHAFKVGDRVEFIEEGTEMVGVIHELKGKNAIIEDEKGDYYEQPTADLKAAPPEEEPPKKSSKLLKKSGSGGGARSSLVDLLKAAEPAPEGGGVSFPQGTWEALLTEALTEEDKEGQRIGILGYTGVNDDDVNGRTIRSRSIIQLSDGSEGPGLGFYKRDLLKLGIDLDTIESDEELDAALEALQAELKWVDITVKPQKKNPEYMNVYLDGVKEDQENKPEFEAY